MMTRCLIALSLSLILLAACQSDAGTPAVPDDSAFPTVTPGGSLRGLLSTPDPADGLISNPATVAAIASQPTATPDTSNCPAQHDDIAAPESAPGSSRAIAAEIVRLLSAGMSPGALEDALRDEWELMGEDGFMRTDLDLTSGGTAEIILGYSVPNEGGVLLIVGCMDGRYIQHHETLSDEAAPPELLMVGDMNRDNMTNLLFTSRVCPETGDCEYQTHLITWRAELARFVSLLGTTIISRTQPEARDIDGDDVTEIIVRLRSSGTSETGPLRTGVNIYDWNGSLYVLSIVQLDPPRYRIQIIHQADRNFAQGNLFDAVDLYQLALTNDDLDNWFNDEEPLLRSYALYRQLVIRAAVGEDDELMPIMERLAEAFPDPDIQPVYAEMSRIFWERFSTEENLSLACASVRELATARPEAVDRLNRYGSRSPIYTVADLCPF